MDISQPSLESVLAQAQQLPILDRLQLSRQLLEQVESDLGSSPSGLVQPQKDVIIPMPTDKITYEAIGGAMDVHKELGPGYRENTYQRDLAIKYAERQLTFTPQQRFAVYDAGKSGKLIGYYIPDFMVENRVVVEIKALDRLTSAHMAQVIGYLAISKCEVGLLINFGKRSLEWKRILPPKDIQHHPVNRQWLFVPKGMKPKHN